ncbi:MAG: PQQ-dependent sugar dehydrogenase [Pseudomonadota bacterium]
MMTYSRPFLALSLPAFALASCANAEMGDSSSADPADFTFDVEEMAEFNEPWAIEFAPGTETIFITEKSGEMKFMNTATGTVGTVSGVPEVAYGGQGGLGDVAFLESEASDDLSERTIYLSWAEAGDGGFGAAVGRGTLSCDSETTCTISGMDVIWRQSLKTGRKGHYSHRIVFSPDEQHMFISSGDRQELEPAQDNTNNLGTIVRLNLDGTPAEGNPFADEGEIQSQIWSYGHRNLLGMDFDTEGRLWDVEHGPAGGDELNLVKVGTNYGWPTVSDGDHYNGNPIPDHETRPEFATAAIGWTPVIAPGDMIFYKGDMFEAWQGDALITGLGAQALVQVDIEGDTATEVARHELGGRLRSVEEGPDGSIWVAADGPGGKLFKLSAD